MLLTSWFKTSAVLVILFISAFIVNCGVYIYSVSQKQLPLYDFCQFLPNSWEFLIEILHTYYAFKYTIHCQWFLALDEFCEMPEAWHPTHDSQVD